jgi:hypothetical protein
VKEIVKNKLLFLMMRLKFTHKTQPEDTNTKKWAFTSSDICEIHVSLFAIASHFVILSLSKEIKRNNSLCAVTHPQQTLLTAHTTNIQSNGNFLPLE